MWHDGEYTDITKKEILSDHIHSIKGNGTRKVNIEADSYSAIIIDIMQYVFLIHYLR